MVTGCGDTRRREIRSWVALPRLCLALTSGVALISSAPTSPAALDASRLDQQQVIDRLLQGERERVAGIQSLTRLQHYTASDRRFGVQADMVARMIYEKGNGKRFEVISRSGSTTIQSRIFDSLIADEVAASKQNLNAATLIDPSNYRFHYSGRMVYDGHSCYVLELQARQKNEHLINGKAWIDSTDFEIIHEEGRPSASVSFWVGKPMITQDYEKIGKFWVAKRRYSASESLLLGRSELTIEYSDYHIVEAKPQTSPGHTATP